VRPVGHDVLGSAKQKGWAITGRRQKMRQETVGYGSWSASQDAQRHELKWSKSVSGSEALRFTLILLRAHRCVVS
jgi:hypothetical protein